MAIKPCNSCGKEFDAWNRQPDGIFCNDCLEEGAKDKKAEIQANKDQQDNKKLEDDATSEDIENLKITTTHDYPNYDVEEVIGVITSECVFGMNIFRDFFAGMSDLFGGRSKASQNVLRDARNTCLYELKKEAYELGGDGIIGIDLDYSEISGKGKGMLFLVASGTVVKFRK